jgi:hypothetical protein
MIVAGDRAELLDQGGDAGAEVFELTPGFG